MGFYGLFFRALYIIYLNTIMAQPTGLSEYLFFFICSITSFEYFFSIFLSYINFSAGERLFSC